MSSARLHRLAAFLDRVGPDQAFVTWHGGRREDGTLQLPFAVTAPVVEEFVAMAYDAGWVESGFDWQAWSDGAEARALLTPEALSLAGETGIEKVLTTMVRQDRFVEGSLAEHFAVGHIHALCRAARRLLENG